MTRSRRAWTVVLAILFACVVTGLLATPAGASTTRGQATTCDYDVDRDGALPACRASVAEADGGAVRSARNAAFRGLTSWSAGDSTVGSRLRNTTEAGGAGFVVNGAGEALNTARITIPNAKFGYMPENPSKTGAFAYSVGFDEATLDSALQQLVDNFGSATRSAPVTGGERSSRSSGL